jgi:hypothetical protein
MKKICWDRHELKTKFDRDYWKEPKYGFDTKWHSKNIDNRQIKLGIHEKHDWQVVKMETGPHAAKIVCRTCKNKFVTWLPKSFV